MRPVGRGARAAVREVGSGGGYAGARFSLRLSNTLLRVVVIAFGLAAAARLLLA